MGSSFEKRLRAALKRKAYLQVAECLDALNLTKWKASQNHLSQNLLRRQHRRKQRRKPHLRRQKRQNLSKRRPKNLLPRKQRKNQLLKSLLQRKSSVLKVDFTGPFQGH